MHARAIRRAVVLPYLLLLAALVLAGSAHAAGLLKVMSQGLGTGTVGSGANGINCGSVCDRLFDTSPTVTLTVSAAPGSVFVRWHGDCEAAGTAANCDVNMTSDRLVRAEFQLNPDVPALPMNPTVADIQNFLNANLSVNTSAGFLRALDPAYKQGWMLITRSQSLQTGTARFPRVLLPSDDMRTVFSVALSEHASYPGASTKAVEMMQYDSATQNFHFHEIVLDHIDAVTQNVPISPQTPTGVFEIFPVRNRGVSVDEPRCTRCHSTRNIPNPNPADRGTSISTGAHPVLAFNKPNWDSYDSWPGLLGFTRDRIYQGSVEAAAFRKLLNPWTWRATPSAQHVMEQLELQPPDVQPVDVITRLVGGSHDATPLFSFDGGVLPVSEPAPVGTDPTVNVNYSFDGVDSSAPGSPVQRGGAYVSLQGVYLPSLMYRQSRGIKFFDLVSGNIAGFNRTRVATELANHRFATGGVPIDPRPVALAISRGCLAVNTAMNRVESTAPTPLTVDQTFFRDRHRIVSSGMGIDELITDTYNREAHMAVRKADLLKFNLHRAGDVYIKDPADEDVDLISEYGSATSQGVSAAVERIRQEALRRSDLGHGDLTPELEGTYLEVEQEAQNSQLVGLYRYFLEPLGVPVDKWTMGVRGRSRTYTFADVVSSYQGSIASGMEASLKTPGDGYPGLTTYDCDHIVQAVNSSLASLPVLVPPTYTDVQRVFNKGCIECHGGLGYPPFTKFLPVNSLDFSEEENPASHDRLLRSWGYANAFTSNALDASNLIWTRITATGENCGDFVSMMPCGGPPLTGPDIDTIKRWIEGGRPNTHGDPHIHTIDGTDYDFQSPGEFTLLRGEGMEIQARHTPVQTAAPLPPNAHTGLSSCPSITTAAAIRAGAHRITYEPNLSGQPDPNGMQLRIDGRLVDRLGARGVILGGGGRILPTTAPGGIQIEYPGGTDIVLTPTWWPHYQLWYLDIDARHSRGNLGVMGVIAPKNWLPALPDNSWLGGRPAALIDRYHQLYHKFAGAWRVTNATTLFDYKPGTSTASFTLQGWPAFEPRDCKLPAGWAQKAPPQAPIPIDEARRICGAVINKADLEHCAQDVAVTGEAGFAKAYAGGERIQRNLLPSPPPLQYPRNLESGFPDTVDFAWSPATDRDAGKLTYLHCVWLVGEKLDYARHCQELPAQTFTATATGLQPNAMYYWKVVVDDAQGGIVSSEVRRFRTK